MNNFCKYVKDATRLGFSLQDALRISTRLVKDSATNNLPNRSDNGRFANGKGNPAAEGAAAAKRDDLEREADRLKLTGRKRDEYLKAAR